MTTTAITTAVEARARFTDLLAAEWRKLWSLRSAPWSLLVVALATVGFNAGTAWDEVRYWSQRDADQESRFFRFRIALDIAFTSNAMLIFILGVSAIGAVAITAEYGSGMIRATFAAVPARRSVMVAKASVVAAVMTAFGAIVALVSFGLTQPILATKDAGLSLGSPGAIRVVVASALIAPVCALVGMALGTLIRHGATSIVTAVVVLLILPLVFSAGRHWSAVIDHALPVVAWERLTEIPYRPGDFPSTVTGAWIVYGVWALLAAALAVVTVHHRDQ